MSRISRGVRRALARRASPPSTGEPQARQPYCQRPLLAIRPGRYGIATWFAQDLAAAAVAAAITVPSHDHELLAAREKHAPPLQLLGPRAR